MEVCGRRKYNTIGRPEEARGHTPSHGIPEITASVHMRPPCAVLSTDIYTSSFNPHKNLVRSFLLSLPLCGGRNPDIVTLPKPLDRYVGEEALNPGSLVPWPVPVITLQKKLVLGYMSCRLSSPAPLPLVK